MEIDVDIDIDIDIDIDVDVDVDINIDIHLSVRVTDSVPCDALEPRRRNKFSCIPSCEDEDARLVRELESPEGTRLKEFDWIPPERESERE